MRGGCAAFSSTSPLWGARNLQRKFRAGVGSESSVRPPPLIPPHKGEGDSCVLSYTILPHAEARAKARLEARGAPTVRVLAARRPLHRIQEIVGNIPRPRSSAKDIVERFAAA